jgi:hypothetical protein
MVAGKGGVERSGATVIVPTTAGAIQVLGLRWSQRIPSSRVVLGNETADQCERWTKDYNSLLRAGDPMRALLGLPEGGGCRLVVSAEIDHGRSWIVPVAAAHFADARAQAVHSDMGRARLMIWGTGAIDFSQPDTADQAKIVENDYHLTSKIDLSREHFAAAAHEGAPVLCLLPAGPDAERAAAILRKVLGQQAHHIEIVATLADVIRPIDAFLSKGDFNALPDIKYAPVAYSPPPEAADDEPAAKVAADRSSDARRVAEGVGRSEGKPASAGRKAAASDTPHATAEAPPVYGVKSPPPPVADRPLAGNAPPQGKSGGMSMAVLGGIAAVLIAVVGAGGLMLLNNPAPSPPPPAPQLQTPPAQPRPQVVTIPSMPPPAGAPPTAPPPATVSPPANGQSAAVNPTQPAATQPATPPAADPTASVGRLTILTPPAGSSCQAQVLEMNPRFVETVVELSGGQPVLEIDSAALCGLAIAGAGSSQARFAQGTVAGTVPSLSTAGRIVFNPSNTSGRLPDIAVAGGGIEKIELRRK